MIPDTKLAAIATERLVSDQSAAELAPLLTVDQRALVSILATAELHQLDAGRLLHGYAAETGSHVVEGLADRIEDGTHPLDAITVTMALPQAARVALASSRASGTLNSFYQSWLSLTADNRAHWVPHEQTNAAKIGRAFWRTLVCFWMLSVLARTVIPQQLRMFEEFGIEPNPTFDAFLLVSVWLARLVLIMAPLAIFCCGLYILFFKRSIANNYLRRWLPSRWQQVVLPTKIMTRKLLAWDLLAFRGNQETKIDWDALVTQKSITSLESDVVQAAGSRETQAWILRNMADQKHQRQRRRASWRIDAFILLLQLLIAGMTILAAFALFSMLLDLMKGLS